jgi:hypothetical protein
MKLTLVQNQAIQARIAALVGADEFDRLFAGVDFEEVEDSILYVSAKDEEAAAEIEDTYSLHICTLALGILQREIDIVLVLPKLLA